MTESTGGDDAGTIDDSLKVPIELHAYEGQRDGQILSPDDLESMQPKLDLATPEKSSSHASASAAVSMERYDVRAIDRWIDGLAGAGESLRTADQLLDAL